MHSAVFDAGLNGAIRIVGVSVYSEYVLWLRRWLPRGISGSGGRLHAYRLVLDTRGLTGLVSRILRSTCGLLRILVQHTAA